MSAALPTGLPGKLLALGLAACVPAAVWAAAVAPLVALHADRAEALSQRRVLARRMARVVQTLPELERQAAEAAAYGPAPDSVLQGPTDAVAAAALQQVVRDLAAEAGAVLTSAEALAVEQVGAYRRVGLRVALGAPWPALVRLLQAIERRASPAMLVDDLQVRGPRAQVGPAEPVLEASLAVLAFRAGAGR